MAYSTQVQVSNTVTKILDVSSTSGGVSVTIRNTHATDSLWVGGDANQEPGKAGPGAGNVTLSSSTGFKLNPGEAISVVLNGDEAVYGLASGVNTITVHVLRTNMTVPHTLK